MLVLLWLNWPMMVFRKQAVKGNQSNQLNQPQTIQNIPVKLKILGVQN